MAAPELIAMLTQNDRTVKQAYKMFDECKDTPAVNWGFKEEPLPLDEMKELYAYMKACGKQTFLEVVAYTQEECAEGARRAVECGVDCLMGTIYSDYVNDMCRANGLRYMPFVGQVSERPSVLEGSVEGMIEEARRYAEKGVYGIDLLGYRYTGDAFQLNKQFVAAMKEAGLPVCIAGSVNSFQRLDEVLEASPQSFTIGSAFFENAFGGTIAQQIEMVCRYIREKKV